jgi:hypothetical protein
MKRTRTAGAALSAAALAVTALATASAVAANAQGPGTFTGPLHHITTLASTVPGNGDVNPYGVEVIARTTGHEFAGNVLVSNFNNKANVQGTGTTIVEISPSGHESLFAQISRNLQGCPGGVGLTTALTVLRSGWVIVGSLPTRNGNISGPGCLIVLDSNGNVRETLTGHGINGPWDMATADYGNSAVLFVTNVLNGTVAAGGKTVHGGTVLRLGLAVPFHGLPFVTSSTVIGSGFPEALNSSALVLGPTGVGLGGNDTLYVADTIANRVAGIRNALFRGSSAGTGFTLSQGGHLNNDLGLIIAPNGNILTVNGGDGNLVEINRSGFQFVRQLVKNGAGALFGLAVQPYRDALYFVNDDANTLQLLH